MRPKTWGKIFSRKKDLNQSGFVYSFVFFSIKIKWSKKERSITQSLFTKSRNQHTLEMEAQPLHMTFTPHYLDFSLNCDTMALYQLYLRKVP